jgi:DNA polymerase I
MLFGDPEAPPESPARSTDQPPAIPVDQPQRPQNNAANESQPAPAGQGNAPAGQGNAPAGQGNAPAGQGNAPAGQGNEPKPAMATNRPRSVIAIDSHSLIYQVFHALPPMTSPQGAPVGAVHGFGNDLLELIQRYQPDHLFCVFDASEETFRNTLYSEYKAHRDPMPETLRVQLPVIHQLVESFGIAVLQLPGYEADDILATIAQAVQTDGGQCLLVTSDKDCRQLISDRVELYNLRKHERFGIEDLKQTWGIRPDQVVDFQALVGDSVDNIPGVPLIGPKLASELLQQFQTLDAVLENADRVAGPKRRENLKQGRESALLSRKLAALCRQVPIEIPWSTSGPGRANRQAMSELMEQCGFRTMPTRATKVLQQWSQSQRSPSNDDTTASLTRRINQTGADGQTAADGQTGADTLAPWEAESESAPQPTPGSLLASSPARRRQDSLLPDDAEQTALTTADSPAWNASYRSITDDASLRALVETLGAAPRWSIDTETTGIDPRSCKLVGISVAWEAGRAAYIPVRGPEGTAMLDEAAVLAALRPLLEDPSIGKIGQNIKYDLVVFRSHGITVRGVAMDTMVADFLLEPGRRTHNLDDLAQRYLQHSTIKIESLIGSTKPQRSMADVPLQEICNYAAEDADVPVRLTPLLEQSLAESELLPLLRDVELPLVEVLADLEFNGIRIDIDRLGQLSARFEARLASLQLLIHQLAGQSFNIDSPKQLADVLFNKLKLPVVKKTKTGPSTDAEVLQQLASQHDLPAQVVAYRQAAKLKNTYVDALPELVNPKTQRVHTHFRQDVAATGRLSSTEPNLQNIPIRTEEGREIRSAFLPGERDWLLLAADYSQIELRVLAHYSGDEAMCRAYHEDRDIHRQVAAEVCGVDQSAVTSDMRRMAKTINFGIVYGQSPFGLAKTLGIGKDEAAAYIEAYFARYPGVQTFMHETIERCRQIGYVKTMLGRRRPVQGVRDFSTLSLAAKRTLNESERVAVNSVIQGSAADLIKLAMIRLHRRLQPAGLQARMLLQIHDELLFEVAPTDADRLQQMVEEEMIGAATLAVPLKVDVKRGANWAACE